MSEWRFSSAPKPCGQAAPTGRLRQRRGVAIADLYEKHQAQIGKDEITSLVELIPDEEASHTIEELVINDERTEDTVNQINWESKQREFESLWQRDTEESEGDICEEYLEEPEESNIDFEACDIETVETILPEMLATKEVPATDAEILADILRKASDYADVRRGLYQYQQVKEEAWKMLKGRGKEICIADASGANKKAE